MEPNETAKSEPPAEITEETIERAKQYMQQGFDLLEQHTRQLAEQLAKFNQEHEAAKEKIQRGGTRTSGRII